MKILLTTITCILFLCAANAQQHPVQVTPQLLPPYSLQVSDYYTPANGGNKLNLLLLLRDFNRLQLNVRLRMSVEGQSIAIRTREDVAFTPLTLEAGVPKYVDPTDLAQYFNADNLQFSGISRQQYEQSGTLPEGFYTFCFEVIELGTSQVVSNKGCTFAWMTLSEPPMLNMPRKGEGVVPTNPNIFFQWTPRHTASPSAAGTIEYMLQLVEVTDSNMAPEAVFLGAPIPLFSDNTTFTNYQYNSAQPGYVALLPDRKYAWRVQAKTKINAQEIATFRNNGYSEVFLVYV